MTISLMNAFCRRYDLVYVEEGVIDHKPIHWFLDYNNERICFSDEEIENKLTLNISTPKLQVQ